MTTAMTPAALPRLNATTAPAAPYDRTRLEHGIVHLKGNGRADAQVLASDNY